MPLVPFLAMLSEVHLAECEYYSSHRLDRVYSRVFGQDIENRSPLFPVNNCDLEVRQDFEIACK